MLHHTALLQPWLLTQHATERCAHHHTTQGQEECPKHIGSHWKLRHLISYAILLGHIWWCVLRRQRQVDVYDFWASLVYIVRIDSKNCFKKNLAV